MSDSARQLVVTRRLAIPLDEFEFTFARSSGPGGQNVNKVNSKAILRWNALASSSLPDEVKQRLQASFGSRLTTEGELLIASQRYRDQGRNIDDCLEKLRELLVQAATAPKRRRPTRPSRASKERRLESKRVVSERKRARRQVDE